MSRIASVFSMWVLPLRVLGAVVFLYAFVRMLVAPDLWLIAVALTGAVLWQAGTAAREYSPLYRRMADTTIRDVMRSLTVRVRAWVPVSRFRSEHPALGRNGFIITTQDGHDAGLVMPEQLDRVSDEMAPRTTLGQLAGPLVYVHGVRADDSVLDAVRRFRAHGDSSLPVLSRGGTLAGIVNSDDVERWLHNVPTAAPRTVESVGEKPYRAVEQKLAA